MKRNFLLKIFAVYALSACANLDTKNIAPGYVEAYKALKNYYFGYENELITADLISRIPYASSTLQIGSGSLGLIILESADEDTFTWVSSDGIYLMLNKSGKVIRTKGLPNNLKGYDAVSFDMKELLNSNKTSFSFTEYYSYDYPILNLLKVTTEYTVGKKESIKLLNQNKDLVLISEQIENKYLGWKENNKYWVDETGFVWKSIQNPSPKLPSFYIEVTKKPAE